jgi:hypothetical protein
MNNIERMWVNQPSTLQPDHKWHGTRVLAVMTEESIVDVYLLSGDIVSLKMFKSALSKGWPDQE